MKSFPTKSFLSLALFASVLSGCSSGSGASADEIEQLKKEIATLKAENEQLKKDNKASGQKQDEAGKSDAEAPETKQKPEEPKGDAPLILEAKKPLTLENFAELTVASTKFAKKIIPSNPGTFYTYYESKEADMTYLALTLKIKSLLESGKSADDFADVTIKYDDKYEYRTFSTIEKSGGEDFTYTNITSIEPLKTGTLVFLAEVPKEVEKSKQPLVAFITINGKEYEYKIR
ncbi:bZIP transcription factor [Paenibacillus sp. GCM10027626]|uniref:bZIP transcription factor n=1 Tax=Paenibacillus sp. GCM10027626 TaxID=3273411 RepID=UPI00364476D9